MTRSAGGRMQAAAKHHHSSGGEEEARSFVTEIEVWEPGEVSDPIQGRPVEIAMALPCTELPDLKIRFAAGITMAGKPAVAGPPAVEATSEEAVKAAVLRKLNEKVRKALKDGNFKCQGTCRDGGTCIITITPEPESLITCSPAYVYDADADEHKPITVCTVAAPIRLVAACTCAEVV